MTTVDIWNIALGLVSEKRAISPNDTAKGAQLCSDNFTAARDFVLAARPWSFAISRSELAASATVPTWGYTAAFPLPATVLRVLNASDGSYELDDWRVEGRDVVANQDGPIYVRCIQRVEDPERFSPGFVQALAAYLAYLIAVPLTENRSLKADLWQEYQGRMREAAAVDGQQGRGRQITNNWASDARG